jgi:hypothetical protein
MGVLGLIDQPLLGDRGDEFGVTLVKQLVGDVWMHGVLLGGLAWPTQVRDGSIDRWDLSSNDRWTRLLHGADQRGAVEDAGG